MTLEEVTKADDEACIDKDFVSKIIRQNLSSIWTILNILKKYAEKVRQNG